MVTGGFNSTENTETTEILNATGSSWTLVGALPYARNGLRATTVANIIYLFVGAETQILKYEASSQSWLYYADMTAKEGSKLEVSPVNCSDVQHYLTNTTAHPQHTTAEEHPGTSSGEYHPNETPSTAIDTIKPTKCKLDNFVLKGRVEFRMCKSKVYRCFIK